MTDLPLWLIAVTVLVGILIAGPVVMAWRWPAMPKREWTEEDELDYWENQK